MATSLIQGQLPGEAGKKALIYARESKTSKKSGGGSIDSKKIDVSKFSSINFLKNSSVINSSSAEPIFGGEQQQEQLEHQNPGNNSIFNLSTQEWNNMENHQKQDFINELISKNERRNIRKNKDDTINSALCFQFHEIQKVIKQHKFRVEMVESDIGSGWSKKSVKELSGLNNLMKNLYKYKNDAVIFITSVSRLSRNYEEISSKFLEECKKNGIKVFALRDNLIYDCVNKSNLSADFIKGCIEAQKHSTELSIKMREYHEQQRELGSVIGPVEYGCKRKRDDDGIWKKVRNDDEQIVIMHICFYWNTIFMVYNQMYFMKNRNNDEDSYTDYNKIYKEMTNLLVNTLNQNDILRRGKAWTFTGIKNIIIRKMGSQYYFSPTNKALNDKIPQDDIIEFNDMMKNLSIKINNSKNKKRAKLVK